MEGIWIAAGGPNQYDRFHLTTHFTYDGLNRVSTITYTGENPAVTPNVAYTYDQVRKRLFQQWRLTTVSTAALGNIPQTTLEFDYDSFGRALSHRQKIGAATYTMGYGFNVAGHW